VIRLAESSRKKDILTCFAFFLTLVILSGCLGDHGDMGNQNLPPITILPPVSVNPDAVSKEDLNSTTKSIQDRMIVSSNAAQQSFSGLGAQIGKVAEVFDAAVVKLNTEVKLLATSQIAIDNKLTAITNITVEATNNMKAIAQVLTEFKVQANAQAQVIAGLNAKLEALTNVQIGLKNQLEQTTTTMNAGRDTYTQINQVNKEWVDILRNENTANTKNMQIIFGAACSIVTIIVGGLMELSRRRAEARAAEYKVQLLRKE
jgi:hypothetical protein